MKKERNNKNSMKFPDNVFFKYIKNEKSIQRKKALFIHEISCRKEVKRTKF